MKVKVKDLKANPYRNIKEYPINAVKVEALKASISESGFWDNVLARSIKGQVQVAYGHHRLEALRQLDPDLIVDIPVKKLSNEMMLKIMANENMDQWAMSNKIVLETVKAVRGFLKGVSDAYDRPAIQKFLGKAWDFEVIKNALIEIKAIEAGSVEQEAVEQLRDPQRGRSFIAAVKKQKVPKKDQAVLAKKLAQEDVPHNKIAGEIYAAQNPVKFLKKEQNPMELKDLINKVSNAADVVAKGLPLIVEFYDPKEEIYSSSAKVFIRNIQKSHEVLNQFVSKFKN